MSRPVPKTPPPPAQHFVFHDPGGRRWRTLRAALLLAAACAGLLLAVLGVSVVLRPRLPALALLGSAPVQERRTFMERVRTVRPDDGQTADGQATATTSAVATGGQLQAIQAPLLPSARAVSGAPEVAGFYVNWDDNSFSSLKQHLSSLTELDAEWLHFSSGGLTQDDPVKTAALLAYLRTQKADGLRVVPLVNNYDGNTQSWDGASL